MSKFVLAPSQILVSQMVTVRSVYGDQFHVFRPQLEHGGNNLLKIYNAHGTAIDILNELRNVKPSWKDAFLHRENIAEVL